MSNLRISNTLQHAESYVQAEVNNLCHNGASLEDVKAYLKLIKHAVSNLEKMIDQDESIAEVINDHISSNPVDAGILLTSNQVDYVNSIEKINIVLHLKPNLLDRYGLRNDYYSKLEHYQESVDYSLVKLSLDTLILKLNRGKPFTMETEENRFLKWMKGHL